MKYFASQLHKKYLKGCLEVIESAIKLKMPFEDILYILYCFNRTFKSPFLDKDEYYTYAKNKPFGDIMEELFVTRDWVKSKMSRNLQALEEHLTVWKEDSDKKNNL